MGALEEGAGDEAERFSRSLIADLPELDGAT